MNIPNMLTTIRFFLIPIFIILFFSDFESNLFYAFIAFSIAGITDVLDGYIARKYNLITELGKMLDPLADKLMLIAVLICLTATNLIPIWILIIIIIKESIMVIGGLYLYFSHMQIVIPSNRFGKIGTVVFYIGICLVLLEVNSFVASLVLYVAVFIALYAFVNYYLIAIKEKKNKNK